MFTPAIALHFNPVQLLNRMRRIIARRAARAALSSMSDGELIDIGLGRGDIGHAVGCKLRRVHGDI